jgi:6,7-dimethyl-8-ribityllumazine synthase
VSERYPESRRPFDFESAPEPETRTDAPDPSPWVEPASEPRPYAAEDVVELEEEEELGESPTPEPEPAEPEPELEREPEPPPEPAQPSELEHVAGALDVPDGYRTIEGEARGERRAVAVAVSRFNGEITGALLRNALAELEGQGVARDAVTVVPVPGAFELPLAAMALAKTRRYSCVVALGCVIRGETPHFDYVASEAASGLQLAALETGVPVAFGVLTCETVEQAEARVGRAADAVRSALEMADMFAHLRAASA